MAVVELHRASDDATWYLQIGDEHLKPDGRVITLNVEEKALEVANGSGDGRFMPGNGEPGWVVVDTHPDSKFQELYGVADA